MNKRLKRKILKKHIKNGVIIEDEASTYISEDVKIGKGTIIYPNTTIKNNVVIGEDCTIGPNSYIREGCILANKVKML